jgi:hypothetical protein
LGWDASVGVVDGYRLYYGGQVLDVGNVTTAALTNVPSGTTIYATAYFGVEESDPSNQIIAP